MPCWQMKIRWFHELPSGSLPNTSANSLSLCPIRRTSTVPPLDCWRQPIWPQKSPQPLHKVSMWQPRACSHDAWGQRGFRLHSRPTAQPICSKSCPFLIVGLPHPEDIRVRACFWIIFFVFLIYFFVFWGFRVLSKGFDEMSFQFGIICPIFPSFSCELGSFVACSCFSEVFPLC